MSPLHRQRPGPAALRPSEIVSGLEPILADLRARRDALQRREMRKELLESARQIGLRDGLKNRHIGSLEFFALKSGDEINAWLEGWRDGQKKLKAQQDEISRLEIL
jgi:hypothetical protein